MNRLRDLFQEDAQTVNGYSAFKSTKELQRCIQTEGVTTLYILAHSTKEYGMQFGNTSFTAEKLFSSLPFQKKQLPETCFINTCYGVQNYLPKLSQIGIRYLILTDQYIKLSDALPFAELYFQYRINGHKPRKALEMADSIGKAKLNYKLFETV